MCLPRMRALSVKYSRIIVVYRKPVSVKDDWSEAIMSLMKSMTCTGHVSRSACGNANFSLHCSII